MSEKLRVSRYVSPKIPRTRSDAPCLSDHRSVGYGVSGLLQHAMPRRPFLGALGVSLASLTALANTRRDLAAGHPPSANSAQASQHSVDLAVLGRWWRRTNCIAACGQRISRLS